MKYIVIEVPEDTNLANFPKGQLATITRDTDTVEGTIAGLWDGLDKEVAPANHIHPIGPPIIT